MGRLFDLSYPVVDGMPVYPGDEPVVLRPRCTVLKDGYTAFSLQTGLHAGTHIDAPLHFLAEGEMIRELPLESFVSRGCLLDVRGEDPIGTKPEYMEVIREGDIVLLWTGHSAHWGRPEYFAQHPVVSEEFAELLVERKVKLLGLDLPSPDKPPFPVHRRLLGAGVFLLENLVNLEQLQGVPCFEVLALPLALAAEGCPVRVVARAIGKEEA